MERNGAWLALLVAILGVGLTTIGVVTIVSGTAERREIPVVAASSGGTFAFWVMGADGAPARWNPCEPIHWVLDDTAAPDGAREDLEAGFEEVARRTGLQFEYDGTSDEVPNRDRDVYQRDRYGDRWAPVLVTWVPPGATDVPMDASDRAVTIPVAVEPDGGPSVFVTGQVVFNADRRLTPGFEDRHASLGATILHELGHLVGLDHVDDPGELLFDQATFGPVAWGPGDIAGLTALGSAGGCLASPDPQPLDVTIDFD